MIIIVCERLLAEKPYAGSTLHVIIGRIACLNLGSFRVSVRTLIHDLSDVIPCFIQDIAGTYCIAYCRQSLVLRSLLLVDRIGFSVEGYSFITLDMSDIRQSELLQNVFSDSSESGSI